MPDELFFVRTVQGIEQKLYSEDDYAFVKISGLIRALLIDNNLAGQLANRYSLKLQFWVKPEFELFPGGSKTDFRQRDVNPLGIAEETAQILTKDAFMREPSLYLDGKAISVYDVITTCANVKGGVHFGSPRKGKLEQELLFNLDQKLNTAGSEVSVNAINSIAWATLFTFKPIFETIYERTMEPRDNK
ncbi:hypothetical protein [Hymenobacter seoulensis]